MEENYLTQDQKYPEWLQDGYVRLATKHSDYYCNLEEHVSSGNGIIWNGYHKSNSDKAVAVGNYIDEDIIANNNDILSGIDFSEYDNNIKFIDDYYKFNIFHVSHISSLRDRDAVELIKKMSDSDNGIICTSTEFISKMLIRLGFNIIGTTKQWFQYELIDKLILINSKGLNLVYSMIKVINDLKLLNDPETD